MNSMRIKKINPKTPDDEIILMTAEILTQNGAVVIPTETRYGLAVRADSRKALDKMFEIKGRSEKNPTAVFAGKVTDISGIAIETEVSKKLTDKFLPGPMTLVLQARETGDVLAAFQGKIGIRVSSSQVVSALLDEVDFMLTATSANKSGQPDAESIDEIVDVFGDDISLYLDGGVLNGPVSTVVDCSGEKAVILREGAISRESIAKEVTI